MKEAVCIFLPELYRSCLPLSSRIWGKLSLCSYQNLTEVVCHFLSERIWRRLSTWMWKKSRLSPFVRTNKERSCVSLSARIVKKLSAHICQNLKEVVRYFSFYQNFMDIFCLCLPEFRRSCLSEIGGICLSLSLRIWRKVPVSFAGIQKNLSAPTVGIWKKKCLPLSARIWRKLPECLFLPELS